MNAWDDEYARQGIPSSYRSEPSTVLLWALSNWKYIAGFPKPSSAIDIGCGTGRNAFYLGEQSIRVLAFDSSATAIALARQKQPSEFVTILDHDLASGLPVADDTADLALDIFVY